MAKSVGSVEVNMLSDAESALLKNTSSSRQSPNRSACTTGVALEPNVVDCPMSLNVARRRPCPSVSFTPSSRLSRSVPSQYVRKQ